MQGRKRILTKEGIMEHDKTLPKNRLAGILGMGLITLLMLTIFLVWGHVQGRSHEVVDLYFAACRGLEQGFSPLLTLCRFDSVPLL